MKVSARFLLQLLVVSVFSFNAIAGPTDAIVITAPPEGEGDAFVPGVRLVEDLPKPYVETEYLVSGQATVFNYATNPSQAQSELVAIAEAVPYKTRMIVRRPTRATRFNGTVVIEWWNSTAGFDTAPAWDPSAEYFARKGIVYVGVTNSATSIEHLLGGCVLFGITEPTCGTRYASLSIPENGLAYEMMSQIATVLKTSGSNSPLPSDFQVKRLFHVGESQQGGSVITYANSFHLDGINDGYFIQAAARARAINFGPSCEEEDSQPFPDCTPRLQYPENLVRTDLPVPVYQAVTQTDFEELQFGVESRQKDTDSYRYYEIAGGAHLTTHKGIELLPAGALTPDPINIEDLCENEINSTADGPVYSGYVLSALWKRMQQQTDDAKLPPQGAVMDAIDGALVRDDQDNVTGGVRLPSMEAPVATYISTNQANPDLSSLLVTIGNLACRLSGSVIPFDQATIDMLYADHDAYVKQVKTSVRAIKKVGLLLGPEGKRIIEAAEQSDIGK